MDQRERQVIDELFGKLRQVEGQAGQRDPEADRHIRERVASQPSAPYYMAQAMLVQEQALGRLQGQVQELERQLAERPAGGGGGFLSGLFGGGQQPQPSARPMAPAAGPFARQPPYDGQQQPPMMPAAGMAYGSPWGRPAGGGFLAGAMQTAVGVAGGMLVANALSNAFSGGAAEVASLAGGAGGAAAPAEGQPASVDQQQDPSYQDAGYDPGAADDPGAGDADLGGGFGEEI